MADLERLARLEGELWARRMRDQLATWDGAPQENWPGRTTEARALASVLTRHLRTQQKLTALIEARAVAVWQSLNEA